MFFLTHTSKLYNWVYERAHTHTRFKVGVAAMRCRGVRMIKHVFCLRHTTGKKVIGLWMKHLTKERVSLRYRTESHRVSQRVGRDMRVCVCTCVLLLLKRGKQIITGDKRRCGNRRQRKTITRNDRWLQEFSIAR